MLDIPETLVEHEGDPDLIEGLKFYDNDEWAASEAPLSRAAERGNVTAIFKLANSLDRLDREDEAISLWEVAATWGHLGSCNNYANRLKRVGDIEGAKALYLRAALNGEATAMFNYAVLFDEETETAEYKEWLRKSADAGMLRAKAMLGDHLYTHGEEREGLALIDEAMEENSLTAHLLAAKNALNRDDFEQCFHIANDALELPLHDDDRHLLRNIYYIRGISADRLGNKELAVRDVQRAKEMGYDVSPAPAYLRNPNGKVLPTRPGKSQSARFEMTK